MDDNNKLSKQAKPQEFELIELLFQEYIRSNIASPLLDYSFQARFQSFINQIPSYLHSSSKPGFFTHFFFGSFATLLDTKLSEKIGIKKLHYSFNTIDNLRIGAETDDKIHVFIFTESSGKNNKNKKQDKSKDIGFTKGEWQQLKGREYKDADKDNLEISVIKINKSKGSIKVTVEKKDIQDSIDSTKQYYEISRKFIDKNGQYIYLENEILKLSVCKTDKSEEALEFILKYTKKIHDHYQDLVYGNGAREADQHGFVAGIFNNFRYRENAHVYLEQFAGRGYADIVLLVRGADRATKSIPIIIELKAGSGSSTTSGEALAQVTEYTKGFQPNNMRILSLADNILCVGMNLDIEANSFMQMKLMPRQTKVTPVIQSIITSIMENEFAHKNLIEDNLIATQNQIKILLENTYQTFPGTGEKSLAHYYGRFLIGESLVLQDYDKHIFIYDQDEYIATKTIIEQHATRSQDGSSTKKQKIEKIVDNSNAVTSILLISKNKDDPAIILNIIDANRELTVKNIALNGDLIGNKKIILLDIKFNIDQYKEGFQEYCNVQVGKVYSSVSEYNKANNIKSKGDFKKISFKTSVDLSVQIKNAIDSQRGLIIAEIRYKELFKKLGEVIYPLKSLVNNEAEFQGILEGIFKYYSDTKLSQKLDRRELVLTEFQTGGGGRIDMLVQAIGELKQGTKEYTPVGFELKYDNSIKLGSFDKQQDEYVQRLILRNKEQVLVKKLLNDQIERYSQGAAIKSITDSNKVAIMGIVFNQQAKDHNSLLLTTEKFFEANIVHSSKLYTTSINVDVMNINDLPKPESDNFLPDWVEQETYDLLAKAVGDDDSMLYLSNSALDDKKVEELQHLLRKDMHLLQYIDGLDLSFNEVTASSIKELIKKFSKLVYVDLSDNDLANNNLIDLEEIMACIQVPILKIADVGMNNEQMQRVLSSLAKTDKVSDLEIMHLEDDNKLIMSQDTASEIAKYLRSTRMLNKLNLANNKIGDEAISIIAEGLRGQSTLSSLILTKNSIGDKGAKELGNVLKDTEISNIDLSGNPLGVSGVKAIVEKLQRADNIKSIELVNVGLKYKYGINAVEEISSIIDSLFKNQHLTKIYISFNNIGNSALCKIFNILSEVEEGHNLKDLSLAGNKIDWGAHFITRHLLELSIYNFLSQNKNIRSLDLSLMEIDDDIGKRIASALEHNVSLVNLDLGGNDRIGSSTITSLANILKTHQYLKYLNLSNNKLSIEDLKTILGSIRMNQIVSHIDLSGNDFSAIITSHIGKQYLDLNNQNIDFKSLLQGNAELKYLNLANCKLNEQSLLSLFTTIESNIGLEVLDIRDNKIESSIVDRIIRSLNKNTNQGLDVGLKVLHVSKGDLSNSAISKLTDKSLGILVSVDGDVLPNVSLEERLMQIYTVDPVDKKSTLELDRDHQTFESETRRGHYHYWLQAHDILDIARVHYGYVDRSIELVGSTKQLSKQMTQYLVNSNNARPFTMILNIGENGQGSNHWVSLVLNRVGGFNHGYYIDSLGHNIAGNIASILSQHRIFIHDLSNQQQADGYNCGLWALDNAKKISELLEADSGVGNKNIDIIRNNLVRSRSQEKFEEIRDNIFRELVNDDQRRVNLKKMGLAQVKMPIKYNDVISISDLQDISIVQACLPSTSRSKRSAHECKIGWSDIDEISSIKTRNTEEIIIDVEKFLKYSKQYITEEQKSWQLVRLAEEIQNKGSEKIVGEYKGLFDRVIEEGGYKNYIQQKRIHDVSSHVINRDDHSISPELKLKLINAVGKIQLMHGIHGTIVSCMGNDVSSCILSVSAIGYSFLSQPIENIMVKMVPKMVENVADVTSKIAPKVLLYDTKFIVKIFGVKYGAKIAKGGAGAIAGIFDIVDIGIASNVLIECNKRADSNNPCSDKEIRDSIASITFASVSFISGVGLAAMGSGPAGVVVGAVIMIGHEIYNGISNIIEYEEKYDTTHGENWSIFWRTFLLQRMSEDVEHLALRKQHVDYITQNAWQRLSSKQEAIVAYAIGLGKEEVVHFSKCREQVYGANYAAAAAPVGRPYCITYTKYNIQSAYSKIDMSNSTANTNKLSRVLPKPIANATIICLPQITDADYEKGIVQSRPDAIYECDNAVVMVHNQRQYLSVKKKYIVYDLIYVNAGTIIGSQELNNVFEIFGGNASIFGSSNLNNIFSVLDNKYNGKIYLDNNSTNIIDVSNLPNDLISMEYTHIYPLTMNISITANNDRILQVYSRSKDVDIRYIGRKNKVDKIICKQLLSQRDGYIVDDNEIEHNNIMIDSNGGMSRIERDQIENCSKIILSPNTIVRAGHSNYTIYITSKDYINSYYDKEASSEVDILGEVTIIFPEVSLFKRRDVLMEYLIGSNILWFNITLKQDVQYNLLLKNYFNKDNSTNYRLIDKYGSNIVPRLDRIKKDNLVKDFEIYGDAKGDNIIDNVDYYRNITYTDYDYNIFGMLKNKYNNILKFGSIGNDIISAYGNTTYMEGGKGRDVYIIADSRYKLYINNESEDLALDILSIASTVENITLKKASFNLQLNVVLGAEVIILNYIIGNKYQHIALMDVKNNLYIPFEVEKEMILVPFCHKSLSKDIFVLTSKAGHTVIDIDVDNIMLHKQWNDLLLTEKKSGSFNSLNIILKDYYKDQKQWLDMKLYSYNNGISSIIDLNNIVISAISYQEQYDNVIKEYVVDLSKQSYYINHNYILYNNNKLVDYPITVVSSNERVGVVIFKNTPLKRLVLYGVTEPIFRDKLYNYDNHSLIVGQWNTDSKYQISMFEFDTGLNQERIYVSDKTLARIELNSVLDKKIDSKVVKVVIDCLKLSCIQYKEHRYSFLEEELSYRGYGNNESYNLAEIREDLNSANNIVGETFMLLVFKSYNELLLKYPDIKRESLHKIDDSCFQTVLPYSKIEVIIKSLNDSTSFSHINQYINDHKQDVQKIITILVIPHIDLDNHHKHRHHHGESGNKKDHKDNKHIPGYHRVRRDIEDVQQIAKDHHDDIPASVGNVEVMSSSSSGSSLKPIGYNVINWIRDYISKLKYLSPVEQVKNWCKNYLISPQEQINRGVQNDADLVVYKDQQIRSNNKDIILDGCMRGALYGREYVDGATCYLSNDKGKVMIFPNILINTCAAPITKMYDNYKQEYCKPIEFNGYSSIYCEGENTNIIYTPVIEPRLFDNIDSQLMLGRMMFHIGKKMWTWCVKTIVKEKNNNIEYVELTQNIQKQWQELVNQIQELLKSLKEIELTNLDKNVINYFHNVLEDISEERARLTNKMCPVSKEEIVRLSERLKSLLEGTIEIGDNYFFDVQSSNDFSTNGYMLKDNIQKNFSSKIILKQWQECENIRNNIINLHEQLLLHESYKNKIKLVKNSNIDEDEQEAWWILSENVHFVEIEQEKLVWQKMSERINLLLEEITDIENPTNKGQVIVSYSDIPTDYSCITIVRVDLIKLLVNNLVLLQENFTNYLIMIKAKTDIVQMTNQECHSEDRNINLINYDIYNKFTDVKYKSNFEMLKSSNQLVNNTILVNEHYTTNMGNCTVVVDVDC